MGPKGKGVLVAIGMPGKGKAASYDEDEAPESAEGEAAEGPSSDELDAAEMLLSAVKSGDAAAVAEALRAAYRACEGM